MSLLKRICYPDTYRFVSKPTQYGCKHEKDAREQYKSQMVGKHSDFKITPCGFFVDLKIPYIRASPDGLVECTCCGKGVVEIKCPYCAKDADSLNEVADKHKNFCLDRTEKGLQLSRNHPYYMQCQLQMYVTGCSYCDFVVWHSASLHTERLLPDTSLITEALTRAKQFFSLCILPELVGKWFTRRREDICEVEVSDTDSADEGTWCYCKESKGGDMVGCDNPKCGIRWFHLSCLQMDAVPRGKWMCPTCHPTKRAKRRKL